jgi:ectoine hydroxylase-related dioxygenase (phytanoyl-CoA dioxygenase family)
MNSDFERDGFLTPIDAISASEAAALRAEYEAAERLAGDDRTRRALLKSSVYNVLPAMYDVVTSPAVTDAVAEVLGEDLLLLKCNMFIKEPNTPHFVSWHQDVTYWGLEQHDEVTAWLALSPATVESGCMRFIPGTHLEDIVPHRDTFSDANLLTRGQELDVEVDESQAVDAVLQPGQMSLHHGKLFHASHPNRTDDRRIGAAIRFIKPSMRMQNGARNCATLVRGEDRYGHFDLLPPPRGILDPRDLERELHYKAIQEGFLYAGTDQGNARIT